MRRSRLCSFRAFPEIFHQVVGADEVGTEAVLDGPEGQGCGQVGLAHAGRSQEQDVAGLGGEGQVGQFPDQALIDGGLEGEVKLLPGTLEGQVGQAGSRAQIPFPAGGHLGPRQFGQHVGMGQLPAGG